MGCLLESQAASWTLGSVGCAGFLIIWGPFLLSFWLRANKMLVLHPRSPAPQNLVGWCSRWRKWESPWEHFSFQDTQPAVWPIPLLSGLLFNFLLPWILYNHMQMQKKKKKAGNFCQIRLVAMCSLDSCSNYVTGESGPLLWSHQQDTKLQSLPWMVRDRISLGVIH